MTHTYTQLHCRSSSLYESAMKEEEYNARATDAIVRYQWNLQQLHFCVCCWCRGECRRGASRVYSVCWPLFSRLLVTPKQQNKCLCVLSRCYSWYIRLLSPLIVAWITSLSRCWPYSLFFLFFFSFFFFLTSMKKVSLLLLLNLRRVYLYIDNNDHSLSSRSISREG